jgi:hypothetical protein
MTEIDPDLRAYFASHLPPAADLNFQSRLALALARRRLLTDLCSVALLSLAVGAVAWGAVWGAWPWLAPIVLGGVGVLLPAGAALALALGIAWLFPVGRQFDPRPQT